jgi:DMSO/TMAO reductase YedYZ molybdopterin-dependent catalytic subunit
MGGARPKWLICFNTVQGLMRLLPIVLAAALVAPSAARSQVSVIVEGTERPVTAAAMAKIPRDTSTMLFHGSAPLRYEGVALSAVLQVAGVRSDSLRGPALATRLVIEASDGYRIVLALADLDPSLGGKRILLADRVDGKALPSDEAPLRLIVAGDQRPSRSARQIVRIRVLREP